jgi:Tfp pilus assembly protein PilX
MNRCYRISKRAARQRGASLIVTLVMLGVITAIGISAFVASSSQFRMAANMQFQNVATHNAESALAQAETWIVTNYGDSGFTTRVSGGVYPTGTAPDPLATGTVWDNTTSVRVDLLGTERYFIELIVAGRKLPANSLSPSACGYGSNAPCPSVNLYRITARGSSILGTVKIVQSVFAVRVNVV